LTFWKEKGTMQESLTNAFLWNYFGLLKRIELPNFITEIYQKFPGHRYYGVYQFNTPLLVIKDIDLLKELTIKNFEHFNAHREMVPADVDTLFGNALFFLKGSKWRHLKTALSPSFTSSKMKGMFQLINDISMNLSDYYINQNKNLIEIEMRDVSSRFCNDVIVSSAFGTAVDSFNDPNNDCFTYGQKLTNLREFPEIFRPVLCILAPKLAKALKIQLVSDSAFEFFSNLIEDTVKLREEHGLVRPDMINLLLEARKKAKNNIGEFSKGSDANLNITNKDIAAQAFNYFFAGIDTVATLMSFMAYELCANEDIQNRLREEIEETSELYDNKLTYEALASMNYMNMVVLESLRKWPSQVSIERMCTKPYTIQPTLPHEKPVNVSEGQAIFIPVYGIHHDPEHFPDPEAFNPERFSEDNKANIKPNTFLTFGLGSRTCIGSRFTLLETKIMFFYLLKHFKIVPVNKTKIPIQLEKSTFTNLPPNGFWLGLERIQK